ncbi:lysophospholipid acyltransferase family protein [Ramlibacter sp.]|uniref:lysophospholipid acyltransferase family protein n=1 Tax=Ramlibacter sp. TaxID=1917967 RepID=UPI0017AC41EC|nr:lysophospholipid acyltransferase family protein [Ramlibacter sp.]MBA2673221.1 1-acyl-sn-glycerol-3-phosphate acyltransferase [Ramlibacter sp.]
MLERLERAWRVLATGLCFACFGFGGALLGVAGFPLLRLVVRDPRRRERIARSVIHHAFQWLVGLMCLTGILSYEISGRQRLRAGGQLILANHPTLIDVVLLMSFIERGDCIVKHALGRNPFTRGSVRAAGFVLNDTAEGLVEDCIRSMRTGNNLIIFPEGTRSTHALPLRLQRGAARVALHGEIDITPVRIRCTPPTLAKGAKWYQVPSRKAHFDIEIGEPIPVARFLLETPSHALAARRLTEHLTDYFSRDHELASA